MFEFCSLCLNLGANWGGEGERTFETLLWGPRIIPKLYIPFTRELCELQTPRSLGRKGAVGNSKQAEPLNGESDAEPKWRGLDVEVNSKCSLVLLTVGESPFCSGPWGKWRSRKGAWGCHLPLQKQLSIKGKRERTVTRRKLGEGCLKTLCGHSGWL